MVLAKEYEKDGRVLILAPESLYGLSTLSKSFEGLERMYRAGYAAAEAIPLIPGKLRMASAHALDADTPYSSPASCSFPN